MRFRNMIRGIEGEFVKRFRPTGVLNYSIIVLCDDGRQYVAPAYEWEPVSHLELCKRI